MAAINITNVIIENNPSVFLSPFHIQISFECLKELQEAIEWKLIYVGSAKNEQYDQILDQFSMGPLQCGAMQFTIQANSPNPNLIPDKDDILGVTCIILSVSYRQQEFFRCGYYVYNCYTDPELAELDPPQIVFDKVQRNILVDKPRITRFNIDWGFESENQQIIQQQMMQFNQNINNNYMNGNDIQQQNYGQIMGDLPNPFLNSNGIFEQLGVMQNCNDNLDDINLF